LRFLRVIRNGRLEGKVRSRGISVPMKPTSPAPAMPGLKSEEGRPKADGRSLPPFAAECVAFFSEVVQIFGVPKSVGQIYGILYSSRAPLRFSDIVECLEISKGSASQGLQFLRSLGAVNIARPSATASLGSQVKRSVVYEPELGLRRLLGGIIRERIEPLVGQGRPHLRRLRELAEGSADGVLREFQLDRVDQLEAWRRQTTLLMPVLKTLLAAPHR
jgi:HTH-type transcriptional regulator, glycine betaine synthesis regulator